MPESFTAYSTLHALIVAGSVLGIALLVWIGRRQPPEKLTLLYGWIAFILIVQIIRQVGGNLPGTFSLQRSLPLHVCDIVPFIGIAALLRPKRWSLALTYFWGIGLSIFAFLMPIVSEEPNQLGFWIFWVAHWQIVATSAYLIWVQGYQPTWRDWAIACGLTAVYMALVLPINLYVGGDYGYVGKQSVAGEVAPWPARVPLLWIIESVIFALMMLPFVFRQRDKQSLSGEAHA